MDIDYWFKKVNGLHNKFERLKDPKKQSRIVFELYSIYLQILEVLFINAYALSLKTNRFPSALFIDSKNLQKFIRDNFLKTTRFSSWFLTNYIFAIQKESPDYKKRYEEYTSLICAVAKDYLDNYQLLNAYKHGCRVSAKHGKNYVSLVDKNNENQLLVEADCQITYFSKEPLKNANDPTLEGAPAVYKRTVSFKIQRLFGDCAFVITLLQNLRLTALHTLGVKPREKILTISLIQKEWKNSHGGFSFKQPLFSIGLANKQKGMAKK